MYLRSGPRNYTSVPQVTGDLPEGAPEMPPRDSTYPLEISRTSHDLGGNLPAAEESFYGQGIDDTFGEETYDPHPDNEPPFDPSSFDASRKGKGHRPSSRGKLNASATTDRSISSSSMDGKRSRDDSEDTDTDFVLRATKKSKTNKGTPLPTGNANPRKKKHISTARPQVYGGDTMKDATGVHHFDKEGNRKRGSAHRFRSWSFGVRGNNLLWRLGCWGNHPNPTTRDQIVTDAIAAMKQTQMGQDQELDDSPKWRRTVGNNLTKAIKKSLNEYLVDKDKNFTDAIYRSLAGIKKWDPQGTLSMFEHWEPKPEGEQPCPSPKAQNTTFTLGTSAANLMPPPAQPYSAVGRSSDERDQSPPSTSRLSGNQSNIPFPPTTTAPHTADDSSEPSSSRPGKRRATEEPPQQRPKKRTWAPGEREAQNAALEAMEEERRRTRTSRQTRSSRPQPVASQDDGAEMDTDLPPPLDQSHTEPPVSHPGANVQPEDIPIDPILLAMSATPQNADSGDSHAVPDPLVEVATGFGDYPPLNDGFEELFGAGR